MASVGSSQRLRHLWQSVRVCALKAPCLDALKLHCVCAYWLRGGMCVLMQLMPTACQGRLVARTSGGCAPAALIGKRLSSIVCLSSGTRRGYGQKGFHVVVPSCQKKMNYGH